jgi:hypothetical protein
MPQKPHTIPSTPHRGSGVLPAMVSGGRCSVGAVTRHSGYAAPSAPPRLRVNPSAMLDRMTGLAGYTGVFRQN